jgi:hypothetical protein
MLVPPHSLQFAAGALFLVLAGARSPALFAAGALSLVFADALALALLAVIAVGAVGALLCRFALPPGTLLLEAILALLWQALLLGDSLALLRDASLALLCHVLLLGSWWWCYLSFLVDSSSLCFPFFFDHSRIV